MEFETIIGLEIHAQLATNTKLFCRCVREFGSLANQNTCPVCLGLPGALPTINQKAVEFAIMLGLATNCKIRLDSQFARKNYFYPDLPKAYQISQFDRPICEDGWLDIELKGNKKRIRITRIHMEEDAGKLIHEGEDSKASYLDLNRAGTPLVEIVSEPDIRTSSEAKAYMEKMHSILTYLEICDGNMEKGNLRCDANVSIRPLGQKKLNTRTETKNLNSFKNVQAAIDFEIIRQTELVSDDREIYQETRLWNADKKISRSMRGKEEAAEYRYFPCPDLPVVYIPHDWVEKLKKRLPELPDAKISRFRAEYDLSRLDALNITDNKYLANYFEMVIQGGNKAKIAVNWIMGDLSRLLNQHHMGIQDIQVSPIQFSELIQLIEKDDISGKIAKTVFEEMFETGKDAKHIVQKKGLVQISDEKELRKLCEQIIYSNLMQVKEYKAGKQKMFGFFVGQVMKASQGKANPQVVNQLLKELLV